MENRRNAIIAAIYQGRLNPEELIVPSDPNYRNWSRQLAEQEKEWKIRLGDEWYTELERHLELRDQVNNMQIEASFTYGFKLGANLMLDVVSRDDN